MSTKTLFGDELKGKLLDGIKKLNNSVSSTLGPGGRNVLIQKEDGTITATKDGVTVAKSFHKLDDDIENIAFGLSFHWHDGVVDSYGRLAPPQKHQLHVLHYLKVSP